MSDLSSSMIQTSNNMPQSHATSNDSKSQACKLEYENWMFDLSKKITRLPPAATYFVPPSSIFCPPSPYTKHIKALELMVCRKNTDLVVCKIGLGSLLMKNEGGRSIPCFPFEIRVITCAVFLFHVIPCEFM